MPPEPVANRADAMRGELGIVGSGMPIMTCGCKQIEAVAVAALVGGT